MMPNRTFMLMLALIFNCAAPAVAQTSDSNSASDENANLNVKLCMSDSMIALGIARDYFVFKHSRQSTTEFAQSVGDIGQKLGKELFDGIDAGTVKHPYQFAQKTLSKCMEEHSLPIKSDIAEGAIQACFYRSEVVFYAYGSRSKGLDKDAAEKRVGQILTNRELITPEFLSGLVDLVYSRPNTMDDAREGQKSFVRACVFGMKKSYPPVRIPIPVCHP